MLKMDLRKPKREKEEMGVVKETQNSDGVVYNMAVIATDKLLQYALTKGKDISSVTKMTKQQLAEFLTGFYRNYKSTGPDMVKVREGLFKFFQNEHGMDIINDRMFHYANLAFERSLTSEQKVDLICSGNALNQPSPRGSPTPFSFTGLKQAKQTRMTYDNFKKLYLSEALNGDAPEYVQNKVFIDINLYILNRGRDFLRLMSKSDFDISTDETGRRYVWLKYTEKYNVRELGNTQDDRVVRDGNQLGDRMYERIGDPLCPLANFVKYMTHLHPMNDNFWQRPKPKHQVSSQDYVWYDNNSLGNSSLGKFMQKICLQAGFTEIYTNSTIRPVYIPAVESVCQEIAPSPKPLSHPPPLMQVMPEPAIKLEKLDEDDYLPLNDDVSSSDGEVRNDLEEAQSTTTLDLRDAKMTVLNSIQKLMPKDIQKFVDWLKTVQVMKNKGEIMVLCSPVDRATVDPDLDHPALHSENNGQTPVSKNDDKTNGNHVHEASLEPDAGLHGISIKQVDFLSLDSTHCSVREILPLKVTLPSNDTMLVSGITDNTQLLLHKKCGPQMAPEMLKDRIFYSENSMDVAEVAAIIGTRKKETSSVTQSSSDFQSSLPPRKRKTESMLNMEATSSKRINISNIDEESESAKKIETNLDCLKPATLKSLPLKHKKKVRFSSGMQAFKIKTEKLDS